MQRILVIEDALEYRNFVAELLRLCGYQLVEAEDGETGIHLAVTCAPHLIICDLHLPRLDGFSTLRMIRGNERGQHLPFILLSADADPIHIHHGLNLGANAYLVKPVSANEFVTEVRRQLQPLSPRSIHPAI